MKAPISAVNNGGKIQGFDILCMKMTFFSHMR